MLADVDPAELTAAEAPTATAGRPQPDAAGVAGRPGRADRVSLDVVLVAAGGGRAGRDRWSAARTSTDHPRVVQRAAHHRRDVEVFGDDAGLVVLGRGLVGRRELSVELLDRSTSGQGHGRRLIAAGLDRVPAGERCWAQVAAGNAASLRAFLACRVRADRLGGPHRAGAAAVGSSP